MSEPFEYGGKIKRGGLGEDRRPNRSSLCRVVSAQDHQPEARDTCSNPLRVLIPHMPF